MKTPAKYDVLDGEALLMSNKEKWLGHVSTEFNDYFIKAGHPLPKLRAVCGFTSHGAPKPGAKSETLGQCWYPQEQMDDKHVEIFVSPRIEDAVIVVATLAHELCHAALGAGFGHRKEFGSLARGMGLEGPLGSTRPGKAFRKMVEGIITEVGEMPKGKLDVSKMEPAHPKNRKPQAKKTTLRCASCEIEVIMRNDLINKNPRIKCPVHNSDLLNPDERKVLGLKK